MRALWVLVVVSACVQAGDVPCGEGVVCPAEYACKTYGCASPEQVKACSGLADGDDCTISNRPGHCSEAACLTSFCGNGVMELGEVCDDANTVSGDGCSGTCTSLEVCGNQIIELDEECDNDDPTKCDPVECKIVRCGNKIIEPGEVCDDGNNENGDDCSFDCKSREVCANGIPDYFTGEQCDDGNLRDLDGCNSHCLFEHMVWQPRSPTAEQPPTDNVAGAYDAGRKRLVLFGGVTASAQSSAETWELEGATWIKRAPARSPSRRYSARMTYDSKRGRIVLFGGESADGYDRSTWEYDGINWFENATVTGPSGRKEHVMVYDPVRERVVMFGGVDGITVRNDTWEYDGTTWIETTAAGGPSARQYAGATFDPVRGKVILYGGADVSINPLNDSWQYNGTWSTLSVTAPATGGRYNHTLTFDPARGETLMAGGQNIGGDLSETYALDATGWLKINTSATHRGHVAAFDTARGRVVLWGGLSASSPNLTLHELVGSAWQQVTILTNVTPFLYSPSIAFDTARGELIAVGGRSGGATSGGDETWVMDDTEWRPILAINPPSGRYRAALAYDAARDRIVLFGGQTNTSTVIGDTWELNPTTWTWTNHTPGSGGPSARAGHRMVYDSWRKTVVMFGGDDTTTARNDLWEWNGTAWTQITLSGAPEARSDFGMAFDSRRGRTVIWGGGIPGSLPPPTDTWFYDDTGWTVQSLLGPPWRATPAMTYDSARDRVVMHGGGPGAPKDDLWEYDGTAWHEQVRTPSDPPAPTSKEHAIVYDPMRARVIRLGAYTSLPVFTYEAQRTEAGEICESGKDFDGDTKIGCTDDDCWSLCTPQCPPGSTNPSCSMLSRCGDGTCDPIESCRTCPFDCATGTTTCPIQCGDSFCDPTETAVGCPGDCG